MANAKHLAKLKEGRKAWNTWRMATDFRPDLTGADLREADLSAFDFRGVDFSNANLRGAFLFASNCSHANFSGADLRDANLAVLNAYGTVFDGASLTGARIGHTSFANTSLQGTSLLSIRSTGSSSIGIDTFFNNRGLPEEFLRAAGVPEEFIAYATSLVGKAIEYYSCFISYTSQDEAFARRLHEGLQAKNIRTWFAPEDLKIGDRFRARIDESIRVHDKLVLILSENSINSGWVGSEVELALERENREKRDVLFPIRLDDAIFESSEPWASEVRRTRHIGDFRNWKLHDDYTKNFDRLVQDLKKEGPIIMGS